MFVSLCVWTCEVGPMRGDFLQSMEERSPLSRDRNTMGDMSRVESWEVFRFFQISAGHLHLQHFIWVNLLEKRLWRFGFFLLIKKKKGNFLHFILVQCIWKQGVILAPVDHVSLFENLCKDKYIKLTWFKYKDGSTDKYTFLFYFLSSF